MIQQAAGLPDYILGISEKEAIAEGGGKPVIVTLTVSITLHPETNTKQPNALGYTSILTTTSDCQLVDFRRIPWVIDQSERGAS